MSGGALPSNRVSIDLVPVRRVRWAPSRLLFPLVPAYQSALAIKNAAYRHRWLGARELQAKVISVGNLSVGGAGKTPLVIRLAELLRARGFAVDVLSRGYGRSSGVPTRVQMHSGDRGAGTAALEYGDEPLLIAQATGVPVYVGARRYAAGLLAERHPAQSPRVHLLDDGFQHRRLARAVDIVVLHRSDFGEHLLPAGRLREPLSALHRASVAVLRVEDAAFEPLLHRHGFKLPIWWMVREIVPPVGAALVPAVVFCGIAHGAEFFQSLTRAGITVAATHAFADHHFYSDADLGIILRSLRETGAAALLTTEKDLIRLSAAQLSRLQAAATLQAVPLRARLLHEEGAMAQLLALAGLPNLPGLAPLGTWGT